MKLFTKEINTKLFEQYLTGSNLKNQMVVAKIFNPYGRGTWYLLNSDPEDPEYLWAIVDMDDIEVGSVNRSDLENIRIKPFMLGLERDLSFRQMNALELYEGLNEGKKYVKGGGVEKANFGYLLIADKMKNLAPKSFDAVDEKFAERIKIGMYADGGGVESENKEMVLNNNKQIAHHTKEISAAVKNAKNIPAWVVAKVNRSATDLSDATHYMEGQGESYADGGGIGFIPMDLEEKLAIIAKWGGTNIKDVIGILNAMIDSGLTNNDLKPKPTKNTRFQIEKATEKKIQEIWKEIKPNYKGNFEGNKYYSTLKEMISRNWIYEDVLAKFKPFRKYQKPIYAEGGGVSRYEPFWNDLKVIDERTGAIWNEKYKNEGDADSFQHYWNLAKEQAIKELKKEDKLFNKMETGGGVGKSVLHLYKLTYPNGQYIVEDYNGGSMTPKEALEKMRISLRGFKSYKYASASSDSDNYKKWHTKKSIGYSNTEAWDEVFGKEKMETGGEVESKLTGWKHKKK